MLQYVKTTAGITLLLALSACGSLPTKEKSTLSTPTSALDPLNIRAQADSQFIEADVLSREGKSAEAIKLFEKVAAADPNSPAVYMHLSSEYQKLGKNKEAILNAEKSVTLDPKNIESRLALGLLYTSENSYDKAVAQYNEVLRIQPGNNDAPIYLGSVYATMKEFKKAEQYFISVLKNPNYETPYLAHYYIGLMHLDQKGAQFQAASENAFKMSLKLKPGFEDAVISLAHLYLQQKNSGKALALCQDFEKHERFSARVADLITQIHIDNGDLDKAYTQLDLITGNSKPSLEVEMKMALILIEKKRFNLAVSKLNDLLAKYPDADTARYYLAGVHEESGNQEEAIRNYMLVPQSSKHFNESVVHAAYLLKSQGKLNQALAVTAKGLTTKADSQLYIMRASLLDAKSDYLGAAQLLEQGLTKFAKNTEMLFQHAVMLDRLGKKEAMIGQMKKVLELAPDHVQSMSYLAFSLAELNQHLSDAEGLARRALELAPEDGYVMDTLGWVLFKQKKFSESVAVLEKALATQSSASIIAEHLADAYLMQSQTEKAKEMYKKAVSLTTDEARASKIRGKLQKLRS